MFRRLLRSLGPRSGRPTAAPADLARRLGVPTPDPPRALVLYQFDACPWCQIVLRAIDQLAVDVTLRDTRRDPDAARAHRETTGRTQVPCLYIDGQPLFESADIVEWLRAYAAASTERS